MTKEDLIKCGCWFTDTGELVKDDIDLNAFADLVRAAERKEWEKEFAGMGEWAAVHMLQDRYK